MSLSVCILAGGKTLSLAATLFTLSWMHSVEKVEWQENWRLDPSGLVLMQARVRGSGAGMEPGEDAVLKNGWWQWVPRLEPQQKLVLAASGAAPTGWTLCTPHDCLQLGRDAGPPIIIEPCEAQQ